LPISPWWFDLFLARISLQMSFNHLFQPSLTTLFQAKRAISPVDLAGGY